MQFLYPQFLWALGLIAIPVIIHLFNFRRYKKLIFSNISFIKNATTVNKKKQTIKNWLVLLCRILAIIMLVLAFAQPYIPFNKGEKKYAEKIVLVYVDNSFSMSNIGENGELLEVAKNKARELSVIYGNTARYQLLTNNFEGRHQQLVNKDAFNKMVDEITLSSKTKELNSIVSRQKQLINQFNNTQINSFIISDFQQSFYNPQNAQFDSLINFHFVPLKSSVQNNIKIDTAYVNTPFVQINKPAQLIVKVTNLGNTAIENQPLVLKLNGIQKAIQNYSLQPNKSVNLQIDVTLTDTTTALAELMVTDFPITFDDTYFLTLRANNNANVLLINNANNYDAITKVYQTDNFYQLSVQNLKQINYAAFNQAHLIILNEPSEISSGLAQELEKYVEKGGNLFVIPQANNVNASMVNFVSNTTGLTIGAVLNQNLTVSNIDNKDVLFNDVFSALPKDADWPTVKQVTQLLLVGKKLTKPVITLNNGWYYLTKTTIKKGNVFLLAGTLNAQQTSLIKHALFVPLMLKMPLLQFNTQENSYSLANTDKIKVNADVKDPIVAIKNNQTEFTTNAYLNNGNWYLNLNNQFSNAGFYKVFSGKKLIDYFALNYARTESDINFIDPSNLSNNVSKITDDLAVFETKVKQQENGKQFWFTLLFAALFFLVAEVLILRFVK